MIIVETPVSSIEEEISRLQSFEGPNAKVFARGAIEALQWILYGTRKPSSKGAAPLPPEDRYVH